jgi:hypothetical protein
MPPSDVAKTVYLCGSFKDLETSRAIAAELARAGMRD